MAGNIGKLPKACQQSLIGSFLQGIAVLTAENEYCPVFLAFLCSGGKIIRLDTKGLPLGIKSRPSYEDREISFLPDDTLLLFSDAFTETPNDMGIRLGNDGFEQMVLTCMQNKEVQKGMQEIMKAFFDYAPPPPPDDATAVLVRFLNDD